MKNDQSILFEKALSLLRNLIATSSFSKEEDRTAAIIFDYLKKENAKPVRVGNNVFAINEHYDPALPTILLNSHHDTVRPNASYTLDPFSPVEKEGKLFGLGSNDAGGCLVSLISTFLFFNEQNNGKINIILAATAEEEISGKNGIELLLNSPEFLSATKQMRPEFQNWSAIVGEPTQLQLAVAERGLMVLDCVTIGKAGHAAREEGDNALYRSLEDITWFREYRYEKVSDLLGPVKQTVTVIETENRTHNIVPSVCKYVVDIRVNELYTFDEILTTIRQHVKSSVTPRSTRLRSTVIQNDDPLVKAGLKLGSICYGSPTTSDKALIPFPALKVGPGDSARSHSADEFIFTEEIKMGIQFYIGLLKQLL